MGKNLKDVSKGAKQISGRAMFQAERTGGTDILLQQFPKAAEMSPDNELQC